MEGAGEAGSAGAAVQGENLKVAAAAKAEGQAFLAANAQKEGVTALDSGLQYQVIRAGTGAVPSLSDDVKIHYRGTLLDGTVFDETYERGEPATMPVARLISGWTEALMRMKTGAKWELYIPSDLAYGFRGQPPHIPSNATLIFEVELLEIVE